MKRAALAAAMLLAGCVPAGPGGPSPLPRPRHGMAPPQVERSPLATTLAAGRTTLFWSAVRTAGLDPVLAGPGPFTVLAPTDATWRRLAPGVGDALLKPENRDSLTMLLRFHILPGQFHRADLMRRTASGPLRLPTLAGEPITVLSTNGTLVIADAGDHRAVLVGAEQPAANGMVDEVDGFLVPQALGPQPRVTIAP